MEPQRGSPGELNMASKSQTGADSKPSAGVSRTGRRTAFLEATSPRSLHGIPSPGTRRGLVNMNKKQLNTSLECE